jgi:hypothetical protein
MLTTRRRVFDIRGLTEKIRIFEGGVLLASHAPLKERGQKGLADASQARQLRPPPSSSGGRR